MAIASRRIFSALTFGLVLFVSLSYSLSPANIMDSLDFSFKIEIDGKAIAKADDLSESPTQAIVGESAAVFTLQNNMLKSGDWILARNKTEDRSLLPKKVLWFKSGTEKEVYAQPVSATKNGSRYQINFAGANLLAENDGVFVELMGDGQPNIIVKV